MLKQQGPKHEALPLTVKDEKAVCQKKKKKKKKKAYNLVSYTVGAI